MVSFMISLTWTRFKKAIAVGMAVVLEFNACIVLFKDSPLILGKVLMTNLSTTSSIVFGFYIVNIVVFSFLISKLLLEFSFDGGVVDYIIVFILLVLKILIVDRRYLLLTFNYLRV